MKLNAKVGIFGVAAALLVAFGAFGVFGGGSQPASADIQAAWVIGEHQLEPTSPGTASNPSCAGSTADVPSPQSGTVAHPTGAVAINLTNYPNTATGNLPLIQVPNGQSILICVNPVPITSASLSTPAPAATTAGGASTTAVTTNDITFDSHGINFFDQASCGNIDSDTRVGEYPDDACANPTGNGSSHLVLPALANSQTNGNNWFNSAVIVRFTCAVPASSFFQTLAFPVTINQPTNLGQGTLFTFIVSCRREAATVTITTQPATVEIIPARSNTSHSLLMLTILDAGGSPSVSGRDVTWRSDRCALTGGSPLVAGSDVGFSNASRGAISTLALSLNPASPATYAAFETNAAMSFTTAGLQVTTTRTYDSSDLALAGSPPSSRSAVIVHCNPVDAPGITPGVATITATVEVPGGSDLVISTTVTVIGPPASVTLVGTPTSVACGQRIAVVATVKDAIGQAVSDHTRVEMVTNLGGVIGGTGAVAGGAGPVVPISSTVGDTFGGVMTAILITSEVTTNSYELVATTGGTISADPFVGGTAFGSQILGGQFSTAPVSGFLTVSCALTPPPPAATIAAPRTGTGISPPNTGDAGLLGSSSSTSWTLFAIGGAFALTLAGLATFKFARR